MRLFLLLLSLSSLSHAATLSGRVVTTQGAPLAKVVVNIEVFIPKGDEINGVDKSIQTGADGRFTLIIDGAVEGGLVRAVRAAGFLQRTAGLAEGGANGDWHFADIRMAAQTRRVSGRVLDDKGEPVAGALVCAPEAANSEPVETDAQGRYVIEKVPDDQAIILAAHGKNFARSEAKTNFDLTLLPPRVLVPSMLVQQQQQKRLMFATSSVYWDALGTPVMLAAALQSDGALPPGEFDAAKANFAKASAATIGFITQAQWHDAPWLRKNGEALLAKIPPHDRYSRLWTQASIAAAQSLGEETDRAAARRWLETALAEAPSWETPRDTTREHVRNALRWFTVAGIAGALGDTHASEYLQRGVAFIKKTGRPPNENWFWSWGQALCYGGPELFNELPREWNLKDRASAVSRAVYRMAPVDLNRARALHEMLKAWEKTPEFEAFRREAKWAENEKPWSDQTLAMLIRARAMHDPASALFEAEQIEKSDPQFLQRWTDILLTIARCARRQKQSDVAQRALQRLASLKIDSNLNAGKYAYAAALSRDLDARLEAEFWSLARERHEQISLEVSEDDYYQSIADMAFYRAPFDSAASRLQLETIWHQLRSQAVFQRTSPEGTFAMCDAMVAFDAVRAIEMYQEIAEADGMQMTLPRLGAYLMAPESERALLAPEN